MLQVVAGNYCLLVSALFSLTTFTLFEFDYIDGCGWGLNTEGTILEYHVRFASVYCTFISFSPLTFKVECGPDLIPNF